MGKLLKKILMSEFDSFQQQPQGGPQDGPMDGPNGGMDYQMNGGKMERRSETYLTDSVGAIATVLSIMAGLNNYRAYSDATSPAEEWKTLYMTELLWSGVIEAAAIALVFITDSNLLRAIGGFSMVGVNATCIYLSGRAMDADFQPSLRTSFTLHGIALGQAIGTFISTF